MHSHRISRDELLTGRQLALVAVFTLTGLAVARLVINHRRRNAAAERQRFVSTYSHRSGFPEPIDRMRGAALATAPAQTAAQSAGAALGDRDA